LSSHDIEDLTQEVFLRLARPVHRDCLRQPDAFLFTLARSLVRDRARRLYTRAARSAVNLEDLDLPYELPTLEESVEYEERLEDATQALEGLKSETRRAFVMHRVFGWERTNTGAFKAVLRNSCHAGMAEFQAIVEVWISESAYSPAWDAAVRDWAPSGTTDALACQAPGRGYLLL
jgi:DNA-directed RNA polymerase specialized sigma24 family protein